MSDKLKSNEIKKYFGDKPFTSEQLYRFYTLYEPDLNKGTFRWRVYTLKNDGVIISLKRGVYGTKSKIEFEPYIGNKLRNLFTQIRRKFPYSDLCVWETSWLNKYMVHQVSSSNIIVEVDKDAAPAVFAHLQESSRDVYLNPGKYEVDTYVLAGQKNIIVKNLITTSPLKIREGIVVPAIEKILIDIFTDDILFVAYQGEELKNIYHELFRTFNINQSTLKQYANKRHIKENLISFLSEKLDMEKDELLI